MSNNMNVSINGQSQVSPGFRFHPTEEELLHYYLQKKLAYEKIDLDVIREVDLNKLEPWDIQEKCKIGSTPQNDWYFFGHKDKKYPTGTQTNRATAAGFWKATGRDKVIYSNCTRIGMRKTLVFYRGRAPHGQKSDWIMHEYRLDDNNTHAVSNIGGADQSGVEKGWVVCRVFKKKNYHHKTSISEPASGNSGNNNILNQILMYMGKSSSTCNQLENESNNSMSDNHQNPVFPNPPPEAACAHLPGLESPTLNASDREEQLITEIGPSDWAALDRLVASRLNGHPNSEQFSSFGAETININSQDFSFPFEGQDEVQLLNMQNSDDIPINHQNISSSQTDFWSFARSSSSSSSDPLSHLSV